MSAPFFDIRDASSMKHLFEVASEVRVEHRSKFKEPCNGDDEWRFAIMWGFLSGLPIEAPRGRNPPGFTAGVHESLAALHRAKYLGVEFATHFALLSRGRFRPNTRSLLEVAELILLALGQLASRRPRPSELVSINLSECSKQIVTFYRREQHELWSRCCIGQLSLFDLVA